MRKAILTTTLAATLGAATLTSTASAQTLSVNISASLQYPSVIQTTANLLNLLSQGVKVTLLTPTNQPAATISSGGGIVVNPAYPTTRLTQIQVMTQVPGTTTYAKEIYPLAQPLTTAQPLTAQSIVVKAKDGTRQPLMNVMARQAAWAKAPGLQKKPGGMPPGQYKKTQGNK